MNKQELINKIEQQFGKGTKFFRWLGYKNAGQSWYSFEKTKHIDLSMIKLLEILEEFKGLKERIK